MYVCEFEKKIGKCSKNHKRILILDKENWIFFSMKTLHSKVLSAAAHYIGTEQ